VKSISFVLRPPHGLLDTLMRAVLFPELAEVQKALGQSRNNPLLRLVTVAMGVETNSILFHQEINSTLEEAETKHALSKSLKRSKATSSN